MRELKSITENIFKIKNDDEFEELALEIFKLQFKQNKIYQLYIEKLGLEVSKIQNLNNIPFLPIEFFKSHKVVSNTKKAEEVFTSSGTTGKQQSKHFVTDVKIYINSFLKGFKQFYGNASDYCILALLPSYLERDGSSLVYMANELIKQSKQSESGFYLNNYESWKPI